MEEKTYADVARTWAWMTPTIILIVTGIYFLIDYIHGPEANKPGGYVITGAIFLSQPLMQLSRIYKKNHPKNRFMHFLHFVGIVILLGVVIIGGIAIVTTFTE